MRQGAATGSPRGKGLPGGGSGARPLRGLHTDSLTPHAVSPWLSNNLVAMLPPSEGTTSESA
ncbi:predicted protein [Streptomyces viridochromogenes DSM 40736]|uniref:Predicted protein n=1 Tax=Streptomyces viridochromogenes (strain DSM 40736 / JCM 4977 / BCRC 1201 / Tue 494) TaxID=591159 RepID=D9X6Z9_STRVT|nr:predicted protein [Streptomyces viridochromogenes DSM 40736]